MEREVSKKAKPSIRDEMETELYDQSVRFVFIDFRLRHFESYLLNFVAFT